MTAREVDCSSISPQPSVSLTCAITGDQADGGVLGMGTTTDGSDGQGQGGGVFLSDTGSTAKGTTISRQLRLDQRQQRLWIVFLRTAEVRRPRISAGNSARFGQPDARRGPPINSQHLDRLNADSVGPALLPDFPPTRTP